MELLHGPIRDYAWGSRSAIAELQGRPVPSDGPEAELWLGAHPGAPATVDRGGGRVSLVDLVAAEPGHWLGARVVDRFGTRLPFLLKVLAADAPLSLQAHPDPEQAQAGYIADGARVQGRRNYVDPYHKPELLVAIAPMEALCGFRDPADSADVLAAFDVPALEPVVAALRTGPTGLRDAVRLLLTWPAAQRAGLVDAVVAARVAGPDAELARSLAAAYPGDPGVLVALLLNHVRLAPGEAIWMPAGNLHAYLRGTGVEIMAASDNVLRGGLTPKHVDVDELLRVLRFEVLAEPVVLARPVAPGVVCWPVPVEDFALHRVTVDAATPEVRLPLPGPRVVLCRAGRVSVDDGTGPVALAPGQAAVGPAAGGPLVLTGAGEAFVATAGLR
ncbi:mannose-6-phosphate isomerase, class I [Micromonospora purpureochromogenes]|uniref:mannose-6-phosphate isomerase, class I n=1 Tax=Micromonospora purpureochromogenes TaxID=47872 RepID=UPI0033ECFB3C